MVEETWGHPERSLQVFISSPNDVTTERNAVSKVIEEVNRTIGQRIGISLHVRMWERFRPRGQNLMEFIERQLKNCDLFLMIFSRRFGSPPSADTEYISGTEAEYQIASKLRNSSSKGRPEIFAYFREIADESILQDPGTELKKILAFKEKIKHSVFYKEYSSQETFPLELKDHLIEWILEMSDVVQVDELVERKRGILQRFFSLGAIREESPSALIVYPPIAVEKEFGDVTHLLPYMVLEDFLAIHKLTKDLNIAGIDKVRATTTEIYDERRERHSNKIFICLPRNKPAENYLSKIPESRFCIEQSIEDNIISRKIIWQSDKNSTTEKIVVQSPQSKYLRLQRSEKDEASWKNDPGKCTAVDFAVVARLPDPVGLVQPELRILSTLFVFGIRGLGTWGAAWYIDICYEELSKYLFEGQSYQALLKVTYWNYRIREVIDVSDQPREFFDNEMNTNTIKKKISEFK